MSGDQVAMSHAVDSGDSSRAMKPGARNTVNPSIKKKKGSVRITYFSLSRDFPLPICGKQPRRRKWSPERLLVSILRALDPKAFSFSSSLLVCAKARKYGGCRCLFGKCWMAIPRRCSGARDPCCILAPDRHSTPDSPSAVMSRAGARSAHPDSI